MLVKNYDVTLLSAVDAYHKTKDNLKKCTTKELAEISKKNIRNYRKW